MIVERALLDAVEAAFVDTARGMATWADPHPDRPPLDEEYSTRPGTNITHTDRVVPRAAGALPLVIARSALGPVVDAGVTLGAGDPAACIAWIPGCGCDACDSGSQNELDLLDEYVLGVVTGAFRRLSLEDREVTVFGQHAWSASGGFARGEVERILADPTGWHEVSGPSWLDSV